jgi:multidrug efflux system outer membrane protein
VVFDAGRTTGRVKAATARREQLLAQYQGTVQNAFREVKDALVASRKSAERLTAEQARVGALRTSLRLAYMRYLAGESSLLDALDAFSGTVLVAKDGALGKIETILGGVRRPYDRYLGVA